MNPEAADRKVSPSSLIPTRIIRKSIILYFISVVAVPVVCFIFGWRSLENIGTGFIYGALGLALFGALTFAGNTIPAQLSRLPIPKYTDPSLMNNQEAESDGSLNRDTGKRFLFTTLISGAFLFITGLFLKILSM